MCAACVLGVAFGLMPGAAKAGLTIENTASVSFTVPGADGPTTTTLRSNTVRIEVLPLPTPAQLQFLRYDPDASQDSVVPVDGGQCLLPGGDFVPLPGVHDSSGAPVDPGTPTDAAPGYYVGEPIVVTVSDPNRNADSATRESVTVDLSTSTGDAETLRLMETGPDTGVFAGVIQSLPIPPDVVQYDCQLSLVGYAEIRARYADNDFPLDALSATAIGYAPLEDKAVLRLSQTVSKPIVEIGDYVQYTLVVSNIHEAPAYATRIIDNLPPGLRYEPGSLRVGAASNPGGPVVTPASLDGAAAATAGKPVTPEAVATPVTVDGGTFTFPVGNLAPGASVTATFVASVGPGAVGQDLVNTAIARASGSVVSNTTDTVIRMRESMNNSRFTIIGRITEGECGSDEGKPVQGVRVVMEDGTFASTDATGAYHIEGVRPGTHVVQMDLATLPAGMEVAPCNDNTRHAGRGYSQFVEAQGGSLWRADFRLQRGKGPAVAGEIGVVLGASQENGELHFTLDVDGDAANVTRARSTIFFPADTTFVPGSASLDGQPLPDPEVTEGVATFELGDPGPRWRRKLVFALRAGSCPSAGQAAAAMLTLDAGSVLRSPPVRLTLPCDSPPGGATSPRTAIPVAVGPDEGPAASPSLASVNSRPAAVSDQAANGMERDWFAGQSPGREFLFPAVDHNPRAPTVNAVLKTMPGDQVVLRLNGEPVSPLNYDGSQSSADGGVVLRTWTGLDIHGGDNVLKADITDRAGKTTTIERIVHFSLGAARAELVPEKSFLVADGIQSPVIAVRMLDRSGRPVNKGAQGKFTINPPYTLVESILAMQQRQLAGRDAVPTTWKVEGDDGIAYFTLAPTGTAGGVELGFDFNSTGRDLGNVHQEVRAWLKSAPRDWIVVGFAAGSVGYDTLEKNMESLAPGEEGSGVRGDGKVSLYAKGRVLGKWMLTLAYDSDKPTDALRNRNLLSVIDPNQYYTLYGDGSSQGYDAASAYRIYLKLERDQFYALFGDFVTGLDQTELSRYSRTLTGVKVAYRGQLADFAAFAAKTAQNHARDELQGDGTSGLYRLSRHDIVLNSEQVRIETRERFHSEHIIESRTLVRHIDYDIDYDNGTLFFREPIASRDFDLNPNWIVVDYETTGTTKEYLNTGGRAAVHLLDDRLEAGTTYIRDEDAAGSSQLFGLDAKFRMSDTDQFRAEAAATRGDPAKAAAGEEHASGNAWLVEWQHHSAMLSLLAYAQRQAGAFGLGQQNASESGTFKAGVKGKYSINARWALQGDLNRVENLATGAFGDMLNAELAYRGDGWGAKGGLRWARDTSPQGKVSESRLATLGADRFFLDHRLQLNAQAEFAVGGSNGSADYPTRLQLGASFAVTKAFNLLLSQDFTDGETRDTSTTRLGFNLTPWANARLTSTVNQSRISEYGPRTFAMFGLNQKFLVGERWGLDLALDSSQSLSDSGEGNLVEDPSQPIRPGGLRDGGALTSDFVALSGGVTYRADLWTWNARLEGRQGDQDRYGLTTAFMRQATEGSALSASAQAFSQRNRDGSTGVLADAQLSWAYRPFGSNWSILEKLEFRLDQVQGGNGEPIIGNATLATSGDARSARFVNNLVLNYASDAWDGKDGGDGVGSVLDVYQRSQLSLYYGSKYVLDTFNGDDYAGYTDILGVEARYDLSPRIDVGLRASVLHSWSQNTFAWAFGPSIGFTPFTNAWVSVGYNIRGFNDRDFDSSHYTAEGAYLVFRMKFDQQSLGLDRARAAAGTP